MLMLCYSTAFSEEIKLYNSATVWNTHYIDGFELSETPSLLTTTKVTYKNISGIILAKQSLSNKPSENYIQGILDYKINKNLSVNVKSYSLHMLDSRQRVHGEVKISKGNFEVFARKYICTPEQTPKTPQFDDASYIGASFNASPTKNITNKITIAAGNKSYLRSKDKNYSIVNVDILTKINVSERISLLHEIIYNPYLNDGFEFNDINNAIGVAIKL